MTDLRTAAQQALEALEAMQSYAAAERKGLRICDESITALRAALAEDAMQKFTDVNQELEAALAEPDTCTWQQDGDSDSGVYGTSCRRYFNFEDGTPEDNKFAWCCFCGKKLAQELITEDEDE